MTELPINEVFATVQGEGGFTGAPSIFVRLQGCPVGCPWCDTKHTWEVDPARRIDVEAMQLKERDSAGWAPMSAGHLAWLMRDLGPARHAVITGGEPALYDLRDLSRALFSEGFKSVQVETSGTHPLRIDPAAFVTVAPKLEMPGDFAVLSEVLERANEIKMPVGKPDDIAKLFQLLNDLSSEKPVYLAPISQSRRATELCIAAAAKHGWRVSFQVHKYAGLR
jgi:7-carboxy-7-deazaguanine synthase